MAFEGIDPVQFGVGVSSTTLTQGVNDPQLGTKITKGGNDYVFVYNSGGTATQNQIVCLNSGASGYSVTVSSVVETGYFFGVAANTALTAAAYGWVLTRGFCDLEPVTAVASGNILIAGLNGQVEPPAVATNATAWRGPVQAIAQEATIACGAAKCYINAFG